MLENFSERCVQNTREKEREMVSDFTCSVALLFFDRSTEPSKGAGMLRNALLSSVLVLYHLPRISFKYFAS